MRDLNINETMLVNGGTETTDAVKENARTAVETCGAGNVKSVSDTGFECKA